MLRNSDNKSVRYVISVMKVLGMWDFDNEAWNQVYHIYGWLLHLIFTFINIALMFAIAIQVGVSTNAEAFSKSLYMALTEIALFTKIVNAMIRAKKIVKLVKQYELFTEGIPRNEQEYDAVTGVSRIFRRLRNAHYFLTIIYLILLFCSTLYKASKNTYTLPHPIWLPYNYNNSTNFYHVFAYSFMSLVITAMSNCSMDVMQSYLLCRTAIYYKVLGTRLENLGRGIDDVKIDLFRQIKFHSSITKLTGECQFLISLPIFVQIIISAFVICFSMYLLQKLSFLEDTADFILFMIFASAMALQIFLPCRFGNEVTTSAAYLRTCIYKCDWLTFPLKIQKMIFIYMEHLKWPVVVRGGHFFNIGYDVFVQVMYTAYRLYAVMVQMDT